MKRQVLSLIIAIKHIIVNFYDFCGILRLCQLIQKYFFKILLVCTTAYSGHQALWSKTWNRFHVHITMMLLFANPPVNWGWKSFNRAMQNCWMFVTCFAWYCYHRLSSTIHCEQTMRAIMVWGNRGDRGAEFILATWRVKCCSTCLKVWKLGLYLFNCLSSECWLTCRKEWLRLMLHPSIKFIFMLSHFTIDNMLKL